LLAGIPITLNSQEVVYLRLEHANSGNILADIESYRSAGRKLSHAYQLLQEEARDRGIGTNVLQLQAQFNSAYQAYQSSNYPAAFLQASQVVSALVVRPPTLSLTPAASSLRAPLVASFSSFFGSRSPTNLVNGSGLILGPSGVLGGADTKHGNDTDGSMWYGDPYGTVPDTNATVTFDLGSLVDLQTTRIWQYNQPGGFTVYGAKRILVSVSTNNMNFTPVAALMPLRAGGTNGEPSQDFATVATGVRYVRLQIVETFAGAAVSGLSEVRFLTASSGVDLQLTGLVGEHYRIE
jgi:hypothetical protein